MKYIPIIPNLRRNNEKIFSEKTSLELKTSEVIPHGSKYK